jgi:hypothetical protein
MDLEPVIDAIMKKPTQSSDRLKALADFVIDQLRLYGLPGAIGGTTGELREGRGRRRGLFRRAAQRAQTAGTSKSVRGPLTS